MAADALNSRYNLKRRVASLPPLTSEIFAEKVLANKASAAATAARASFEKTCEACRKTYYSQNAYQNHLSSQKHRTLVATMPNTPGAREEDAASLISSTFSLGEPIGTPTSGSGDKVADEEFAKVVNGIQATSLEDRVPKSPISGRPHRPTPSAVDGHPDHPISESGTETPAASIREATASTAGLLLQCLFCNFSTSSLPLNMGHMTKAHGLFIPEREYLTDLEGLIKYLNEKVSELHECLYCHQAKHTRVGAQAHMRDVGHCMIGYDDEEDMLEIGQFYDFRSTYSDVEDDDEMDTEDRAASGGVKLGARRGETISISKLDGEGDQVMDGEDEDAWESDSTLSSVPTDEIGSVAISDFTHRYEKLSHHRHHSHSDPRPHHNTDGFHSHAHHLPHAVYHDDFELHLPSGRTAGHRSLNKYYRQNLRNYVSPSERPQQRTIANANADESEADEGEVQSPAPRGREQHRAVVSRANGGLGMMSVAEPKKKEVRVKEKREQRRNQRAEGRLRWMNEKQGNFQKHYRVSDGLREESELRDWLIDDRIRCFSDREDWPGDWGCWVCGFELESRALSRRPLQYGKRSVEVDS
ncbi:MAG: hypothetical protein M1820_003805 [Bogoriella megaspora]|nr:MAG: hypothetical protein M1820_003805 [Bogoriella megaspora]